MEKLEEKIDSVIFDIALSQIDINLYFILKSGDVDFKKLGFKKASAQPASPLLQSSELSKQRNGQNIDSIR